MGREKRQDIIEDSELCEGLFLSRAFYEKKENRLLTLLLKGMVVYLLSMGSIGFYMSALKIEYNEVMCHLVVGIMAVFCALLYYRLLVENLGYLLLLAVFGSLVFIFRTYINSGFYAVVNITVDMAAQYFDVDIQRLYNEQIGNRYVTVTFVALFIGIVLDILLNVYISRRMQYVTAIVIVMFLNVIPLYLTEEPDMFYSLMLLSGIAMAYAFKSGKHYSPQVSIKRTDCVFEDKNRQKRAAKRKKEISYVYDVRAMLQAGATVVAFIAISVTVISSFRPKENFNAGYRGNKYKELSMAAVSTLLVDGWSGFYRNSDDVGGLSSGRLGDVSSIYLDHQTDLVVQVTPYSYDMIYLKSFVGQQYNPYVNSWTAIDDLAWFDNDLTPEADALREAYETGQKNSARGVMHIRNVGASRMRQYLPYYYSSVEQGDGSSGNTYDTIIYYPRLIGNDVGVKASRYGEEGAYTEHDLYVPQENMNVIAQTVNELELGNGTPEEAVQAILTYFQDNIPYTVRPGRTPRQRDFVNYFLTDNRKGYCAHYASAATLMLRYMGIPARYVEGYAIDYYQILEGELVENAVYGDYYQGYSELGETALVEVPVTDADAHAWVEIYTPSRGWYVVDVTPAGETEEIEDFWEMFDDIMGDSDQAADIIDTGNAGNFHISDALIRNICYVLLGLLGTALLVLLGVRGGKLAVYMIRFRRADINDKLIMLYTRAGKRFARRHKEFAKRINYREQVCYIYAVREQESGSQTVAERDTIIEILERAGFSDREISAEEYELVSAWTDSAMK